MSAKVLTSSEKLLLSSVGIFATSLTLIVIFCVVKKNCWLHRIIWNEEKKKKHKLDDLICIRYPPDIYPPSIGIYRENIIRSPEDELARLFHSPTKRDSTYSSMSETSSGSAYDLSGSSQRLTNNSRENSTTNGSPVTNATTPETPGTTSQSPDLASGSGENAIISTQGESPTFSSSSTIAAASDHSSTNETNSPQPQNNSQRAAAAALAAEAVAAANQRQNNHYHSIANSNIRQPFFTFALKYEEDNNLVRIDFIKRGEVLIGLCYLPTAERMSVTIVKATNLNPYFSHGTITKQSICYVRLLLLRADTGRVLKKKKTTFQKLIGSNGEQPLFNETLVFDMPPNELIQTVVLALVCFANKPPGPKQKQHNGANMYPHHQNTAMPFYEDSLFHFSGNLNTNATPAARMENSTTGQQRNAKTGSSNDTRNEGNKEGAQNPCGSANSSEPTNSIPGENDSSRIDNHQNGSKNKREKDVVVGKVAFGCCVKNPIGRFHWEKMVLSPRTVVNEWHYLK